MKKYELKKQRLRSSTKIEERSRRVVPEIGM